MTNYTMNTYEIKREVLKYSNKMSKGLDKPATKFVMDMQYGISKSKTCLISEVSRALKEDIKLGNTIERLCDNLSNLSSDENRIILNNYHKEMIKLIPKEPIVILDDTDVAKRYGKKFEDLDRVIDASGEDKKTVNGYHVCEATILTEKEKQPISLYSKIYSCKTQDFGSKNDYTHESINTVHELIQRKANYIFDRLYDDNKIYDLVDKNKDYFVVRVQDNRTLLFKGKKRRCSEVVKMRKGKVKMKLDFSSDSVDVYLSHTRAVLPYNNKEYTLVTIYGLSEDKPMMILTNRVVKNKDDVIRVVRLYMYRWRVEEYFRCKKQEYGFENYRVRTLKSMNNLNLMFQLRMGHLAYLGEKINSLLLSIKIIYESKSLRKKVCLWMGQLARGIKEILAHAKTGINQVKVESDDLHEQLELQLE